jgi:peptidoglycan/LPS O-acetylase OafA/YrhL
MSKQGGDAALVLESRLDFADGLKSISMFYIVGFWHMIDYTADPVSYHNNALRTFTLVLLSVFVLLSGYFSALQMKRPGRTARQFLASKLRGVYAPFILALGACVTAGLFGIKWALGSGLLYGMFTHKPPMTLWFICMLVLYFMATPVLNLLVKHLPRGAPSLLFLALLCCIFSWMVDHGAALDARVYFYFPAYVFGLILGHERDGLALPRFSLMLAVLTAVLSFPYSIGVNQGSSVAGVELIPSLSAATILLAIFPVIWAKFPKPLQAACLWFAGQSYFVYLFHRPLIEVWRKFLFWINADQLLHLDFAASFVINMPLVVLVCHALLNAYSAWVDPWVALLTQRMGDEPVRSVSVKG